MCNPHIDLDLVGDLEHDRSKRRKPMGDMTTNADILESITNDACVALFEAYALSLKRVPVTIDSQEGLMYCGVIGYTGSQIRGTLMLATSTEPIGRTSPSTDATPHEWVGELTNQLLGRIKTRLTRRGVIIHMSTPVVLRGQHLAPIPRSEHDLNPVVFASSAGIVCVWMDAECARGVVLADMEESVDAAMEEGTGMLF
jgi:CheY-specific phosphatase CheX